MRFLKAHRRRRFAAIAASLLLAALVAELLARTVLGLGDPPLSIAHPSIEYLFRPNQDEQPYRDNIHVNEIGQAVLAGVLRREVETTVSTSKP